MKEYNAKFYGLYKVSVLRTMTLKVRTRLNFRFLRSWGRR